MRTSAGTSPSLVGPTSGCSSSPSQFSSATFIRYSCARWTGLRVWNPTTVLHPGVLGIGGAVDQLGLRKPVPLEDLVDLQHAQELAGLAPQRHQLAVELGVVGQPEADRDRPQGAVGEPHALDARLV